MLKTSFYHNSFLLRDDLVVKYLLKVCGSLYIKIWINRNIDLLAFFY